MGLLTTFVGLLLLQEMKNAKLVRTHTSNVAGTGLRMNPSAGKFCASGKLSV
jgi:hypothetical protein